MDIQYLITINLMVISALAIVSVLMQLPWRDNLLWLGINTLVILAGAAGLHWWPEQAGTLAAVVFVPFVLAPIVLSNLSRKASLQNKPERAALLARLAALLHPAARTRFNAAVTTAHACPSPQAQIEALGRLAAASSPAERFQLEALQLRLAGDWRGLLAHLRRTPLGSPQLDVLEIRALGELGRIDEMVRCWDAARERLQGSDMTDAQLFVLAFSGRPGGVATMLQRAQRSLDDDAKSYWLALSQRAAGEPEGLWRPILDRLAASASTTAIRDRAATKLRESWEPARNDMTAAAVSILDAAMARLERQAPPLQRRGFLATPVTYALLAAYVAVYILEETSGGSQNLRSLVDLGALWPPYVIERHEWWRLMTATFLHFGPLHAGANGLMLYLLGRPCEMSFGSLRMIVLYLSGAIASSAFVLGLYAWGASEPTVLVGASGAVMAVFGGLVGHRLVTWIRHRDVLDKRFLTMVPVIMGLQFAADLSMPQVSLAAHASGFCAGVVIGLLLTLTIRTGQMRHQPQTA
jgi:rhomboid protease GluP